MLNKTYKINESKAISETIDGETIIINLETGYYYSVNKTATVIWNEIQKHNSVKNISQHFLNHYDTDISTVENSIKEIICLFLKDELILESNSDISPDIREQQTGIVKGKFIIPRIERYDDMAGALRSDPVHDVNEDGWPNLKQ
ncbi:MAG: PqqD family protein [Deltaproteobacteria bacterium]|nr:PqqD family protein [Deltaproteobacteria bacterium]